MNRFLFVLSICGLVACLSFNLLAVAGIYMPNGMWVIFPLVAGMVIVFTPAVLKLKKLSQKDLKPKPKGFKGIREQHVQTKQLMLSFWRPLPLGLKFLAVLVVVYGFANFFSMMFILGNDQATIENGRYFMESKGEILREITREEFYQNKACQTSLFTGHIAIFYAFAMVFHYKP